MQEGEITIETHQQEQGHLAVIATITGCHIQYNDAHHLVILNGTALACSLGEYRVLLPLLHSHDRPVPFARLLEGSYDPHDEHARRSLMRVVSRLRPKLWPFGFEILNLYGYGYQLLTTREESGP